MFNGSLKHRLVLCTGWFLALGGPAHAELSNEQLGYFLREALGYDARTLSCLGAPNNAYQPIAAEATLYSSENRGTIEPLVVNFLEARSLVNHAYESGGDPSSATTSLSEAVTDLVDACSSAITEMDEHLTPEQRAKRARTLENQGIDPMHALLELTPQQREELRAARQARDLVLRNHQSRKDLSACTEAMSQFMATINSVLTEGQKNEADAHKTAMWNQLAAAQAHDESRLAE